MPRRNVSRRDERHYRRVAAAVVPLSVLSGAALGWHSSEAAYRTTSYTGSNSWDSGNVVLATDQTGTAVFGTLTNLQPDNNLASLSPPAAGAYAATTTSNGGSRCINVTYSGASTANIRMRVAVTNTGTDGGLAQSMLLSVDTGTGATNVNCTGFSSTGYLYGAPANTTAYATGFPTTYVGGAATEWTNAVATTSKWYRISWLLPSNANANSQTETSTITFTWEAQNV